MWLSDKKFNAALKLIPWIEKEAFNAGLKLIWWSDEAFNVGNKIEAMKHLMLHSIASRKVSKNKYIEV